MLFSLAWKNIWRNKKRSLIIVLAITFGLWGGLFSDAVMMGSVESMVETAISRNLSHIQIHKKNYDRDKDIRNFIPGGTAIADSIRRIPGVAGVSGRTLVYGMAASPASSFGVRINGVNRENAEQVTDIHQQITEGDYFASSQRNQIVIGRKLAERLNLNLNSKVVLSFQDLEGNITYIACRVTGIFKTNSTQFDEANVFVQQPDLFRILGSDPIVHEIAVRLTNSEEIAGVAAIIQNRYPDLAVERWDQLAPELAYLNDSTLIYTYFFVGIILFALLFGIMNTMLMSVVDRVRELGMLMAIGMKKGRVFMMILLETIMLSLTGGISGTVVSVATIAYFKHSGLDLSAVATSLESWGSSTMLYPFLPAAMYIILTVMILFIANVAALMPAWKAVHLVPSEAIRNY
jgi:putative ABC transport system permease protein